MLSTTDEIFVIRKFLEKYRANGKKVHFNCVNLEKAFESDAMGYT